MKVILYKNCILNKKYDEVIRNNTVLENYLNTLTKKEINIDDTYIKLNGELIIEFTKNDKINNVVAFDYNYIKLVNNNDNDNTISYAFIDKIEFWNECVRIEYTMDVWSSMLDKWSLRKSLVVNSLKTISGEPFEKVLPYIGNGGNSIHPINYEDTLAVIFKMQLYELTSGGNNKPIKWEGYCVYISSENGTNFDMSIYYRSVPAFLDKIIPKQQNNFWKVQYIDFYTGLEEIEENLYCNIVETYVLPVSYIKNSQTYAHFISTRRIENGTDVFYIMPLFNKVIVDNKTIRPDDTIISYGLFTKQIKYNYNGCPLECSIVLSCNADDFHLYFYALNFAAEITKEFLATQDYEPTTPDVLAQREIARKQQTIQGMTGIMTGIANNIIGQGKILIGGTLPGIGGAALTLSGGQDYINGIATVINSVEQIAAANAEKYVSNTPVNNDTSYLITALHGICVLKMGNIINTDESEKATLECGYKVSYFTDNLDINQDIVDYNSIKFNFIRVIGCSNEINEIISNILLNGTKIWYVIPT